MMVPVSVRVEVMQLGCASSSVFACSQMSHGMAPPSSRAISSNLIHTHEAALIT